MSQKGKKMLWGVDCWLFGEIAYLLPGTTSARANFLSWRGWGPCKPGLMGFMSIKLRLLMLRSAFVGFPLIHPGSVHPAWLGPCWPSLVGFMSTTLHLVMLRSTFFEISLIQLGFVHPTAGAFLIWPGGLCRPRSVWSCRVRLFFEISLIQLGFVHPTAGAFLTWPGGLYAHHAPSGHVAFDFFFENSIIHPGSVHLGPASGCRLVTHARP